MARFALLVLVVSPALADGTYDASFDDPGEAWLDTTVADGVMTVRSAWTEVDLPFSSMVRLEGRLRLRVAEGNRVSLSVGSTWIADYTADGGVSLGGEPVPFPATHQDWVVDEAPTIEPDGQTWDGGNTLHADVAQGPGGILRLYWTGEMTPGYAYRQIGVATLSGVGKWIEFPDNPVIPIDYDKTTVDGIHAHMPSVVVDAGTWHMFYSCYQDGVGNRICHATSADGLVWDKAGVALDLGAPGFFDSGSLRQPEVWIGDDGTWNLLYNGTRPEEHYGPTGWATSPDGFTWTRRGQISADENFLQGGDVMRTPYGLEQWFNCGDVFCAAFADPDDPAVWSPSAARIDKTAVPGDYGAGYVQAPTSWTDGPTQHLWFNAYGADPEGVWHERIFHARSVPRTGEWLDVGVVWEAGTLEVSWTDDEGRRASLSAPANILGQLRIEAEGVVEVDEVHLSWTDWLDDEYQDKGTVCGTSGAAGTVGWFVGLLAVVLRRRRR